MSSMYFDKQGQPLTRNQYLDLFMDKNYCRVASTDVGPYWVSTVWLGLDHGFGHTESPVVFETMVFAAGQRDDPNNHGLTEFDSRRYCTEEEALAGHDEQVLLIEATLQTAEDVLPDQADHTNGKEKT